MTKILMFIYFIIGIALIVLGLTAIYFHEFSAIMAVILGAFFIYDYYLMCEKMKKYE